MTTAATIAFWVFIGGGFLVIVGEMLAAGAGAKAAKAGGMERPEYADAREEGRQEEARRYLEEVGARELARAAFVRPYVPQLPDLERTELLEQWERPAPPATYRSNGEKPTRVET